MLYRWDVLCWLRPSWLKHDVSSIHRHRLVSLLRANVSNSPYTLRLLDGPCGRLTSVAFARHGKTITRYSLRLLDMFRCFRSTDFVGSACLQRLASAALGTSPHARFLYAVLRGGVRASLRRGHANILCIVPSVTDDPRRESRRNTKYHPG